MVVSASKSSVSPSPTSGRNSRNSRCGYINILCRIYAHVKTIFSCFMRNTHTSDIVKFSCKKIGADVVPWSERGAKSRPGGTLS